MTWRKAGINLRAVSVQAVGVTYALTATACDRACDRACQDRGFGRKVDRGQVCGVGAPSIRTGPGRIPCGSDLTQERHHWQGVCAVRRSRGKVDMALNLVVACLDRGPADASEMLVLLAICDSADKDTGEAWPSQATIARRARLTDRAVRNVLVRLVAGRWLTWEPRKRSNGSATSSLYRVNLEALGEGRRGPPARNQVPTPPGTTFLPPPEPGSAHAPEPGSGPEPSHKKEPCARSRVRGRPVPPPAASPLGSGGGGRSWVGVKLTRLQRSEVLSGRSCLVDGVMLLDGSPDHQALTRYLRDAEAA